ncbi:MAG: hypothetical protein U0531_20310 [Dehalococcoidia bacterium]
MPPAHRQPRRARLRASAVVLAIVASAALTTAAQARLPEELDTFRPVLVPVDSAPAGPASTPLVVAAPLPSAGAAWPTAPSLPAWDGTAAPELKSVAAAVIDAQTGTLLFGQSPHRQMPPASITKTVTAMVALERGNLDAEVTVDVDGPTLAASTGSSIGLRAGDRLTLRDRCMA